MELDEMVKLLAGPFIKQQRESSVWVAQCCGKGMASVMKPTTCNTCGQQLALREVTQSDFG